MELWFTEMQTPNLGLSFAVERVLLKEKTPYQELAVLETSQFGRMLVLDGIVQTSIADEFIYHEMIVHVPLMTHPMPRKVLIIGGGDGGSVRETLKHRHVEEITLVEIDSRVIDASRRFLPQLSSSLDDPRVKIVNGDGRKYVENAPHTYDIIIVDSTEPVGAAEELFTDSFYKDVRGALQDDGILVAQTESPFMNQDLLKNAFQGIDSVFPHTKLYLASIPTYPGGLWSFTMGSCRYDPLDTLPVKEELADNRYYTPDIHAASFTLPPFVRQLVKECEHGQG